MPRFRKYDDIQNDRKWRRWEMIIGQVATEDLSKHLLITKSLLSNSHCWSHKAQEWADNVRFTSTCKLWGNCCVQRKWKSSTSSCGDSSFAKKCTANTVSCWRCTQRCYTSGTLRIVCSFANSKIISSSSTNNITVTFMNLWDQIFFQYKYIVYRKSLIPVKWRSRNEECIHHDEETTDNAQ